MRYDNVSMIGNADSVRFLLYKKGKRVLFVLGINPSTANESIPDNTIRKVMGFAEREGFDGFAMINVYPQRCTNPNLLHSTCDEKLHQQNLATIVDIIGRNHNPIILVAFGNLISKRKYLKECFRDIANALSTYNPKWKQIGDLTKQGNPKHPLMAKYQPLRDFDIDAY